MLSDIIIYIIILLMSNIIPLDRSEKYMKMYDLGSRIPSDIIKIIHDQLNFISQVNLRLASKSFAKNPITNLSRNVPYVHKLTDTILISYGNITKLCANDNIYI